MDSSLILKVSNFRCHSEYSLKLNPGQIYLLTGDSGKGKTTIFQAIYWCLYGKATRVAPFKATSKTITSVELELKTSKLHLKLLRCNNPKSFNLIHDDIILDGTTAQNFIDDLFGNDNFWLSTSYLKQKGFNPLIKGTNGEKRKLLDRITFGDEHPDEWIDKCDRLLTTVITQRSECQKLFDSELIRYTEAIKTSGLSNEEIEKGIPSNIFGIELSDLQKKYQELNEELSGLTKKLERSSLLVGKYNSLSKFSNVNLSDLDSEERTLEINLSLLESQEAQQRILLDIERLSAEKKVILENIGKLNIIENTESKYYSDSDIYNAQKHELAYFSTKELIEKLGMNYDEEEIRRQSNFLENEISLLLTQKNKYDKYRKDIENHESYQKLIDKYSSQITPINPQVLIDIQAGISKYTQLLQSSYSLDCERYNQITQTLKIPLLFCPHCEGSVRICENKLVISDKYNPAELHSELESINIRRNQSVQENSLELKKYNAMLREETRKIENNRECEKQVNFYQSHKNLLSLDKCENIDSEKLKQLQYKLSDLRNIRYLPPPIVSSKDMFYARQKFEKDKLESELLLRKIKISELEKSLSERPDEVRMTKKEILDKIYCIKDTRKSTLELSELRKSPDLLSYSTDLNRYNFLSDFKSKFETEWKKLSMLKLLCDQRDSLVKIRDDLMNYQAREQRFIRLKDSFVNIQHAKYAMSTNAINVYLSEIVSKMYTKAITVQLRMFKIIKKGNRIKPNINLHVTLDNEEIDPSEISGGEYDRLSIALTLALSKAITKENAAVFKINHSPMLLLDESFSALPANDRDRTIETIVSHGKDKDKYILCIAPNSSSNWYEEEIAIS